MPPQWTLIGMVIGISLVAPTLAEKLEEDDPVDVSFLTDEDFQNAKEITDDTLPRRSGPAWVQRGKLHGDIKGKAAEALKPGQFRNGVKQEYEKWPNGQIPYVISNRYGPRERAILAKAIQEYHDKTCIRFVPRQSHHRDFLYIGKIDGCFSDVGRAGGRQDLSLDHGCIEFDTAIHELMHAVGFWHEHERWDRDNYISIMWNNIERDAFDQFGRVNLVESDYYSEPYDYRSIMHYDSKSFTKNGRDTMVAKDHKYTYMMGRVKKFSDIDLSKINKMYRCTKYLPNHGNTNSNSVWQRPTTSWRPPRQPEPSKSTFTVEDCKDKAQLCGNWKDRCHNAHFTQIMREFCPYTCGFCQVLSSAFTQNAWTWRSFG